jgi:group I intron endonuclease
MAASKLPEEWVVYKITCIPTGMAYVGMTMNKERRRYEHFRGRSSSLLREAVAEHGPAAFAFEVLCVCENRMETHARELEFIAALGTAWPRGFNIHGGEKGTFAAVCSPAVKARRAAAQKRLWDSLAHRETVARQLAAYYADPAHKEEMRRRKREGWKNPTYVERQRTSHAGKRHSDETRTRLSEIATARQAEIRAAAPPKPIPPTAGERRARRRLNIAKFWESDRGQARKAALAVWTAERNHIRWAKPENVASFSAKMKGRRKGIRVSDETREKMSRSHLDLWARRREAIS